MTRALASFACTLVLAAPAFAGVNPDLLAGMKARSIGPAGMSGRIASVAGVSSDPDVIYVGAATGGLWKSVNGGLTWTPLFDDQPVASIGAVAVFRGSPDVVWVGTGEGNPRNSVSVGNGVYRSLDGGRHWTHLGLDESEHVTRIVLDPVRRDVAYVAALGKMWGENPERGVFKTEDGGKTWTKVLYVDPRTGAADLVMDPTNPNKLFAAMWDYRRWPWSFRSGGPGSGLYVTDDGGAHWKKLTPEDGLPEGDLGRIALAIAPSEPSTVYAMIETSKKNAFWVSRDGGLSWVRAGDNQAATARPFYFARIEVDPERPGRVYSLASIVSVSDDGARTFRPLVPFRKVHPDHHAIWIDPQDGRHIVLGNDGGVALSRDRGETWQFVANLPLAQYYHIRVDDETPYNVYGGMQDNGSWRGPSSVWENGGIRNLYWEEVGFGDGFDTAPYPKDPLIGYSMSQEGHLRRFDLRTGERKDIRPAGPPGVKLRFNWNAAFAQDPFDADTIYYGSQFVHRSKDRGESWEIISPDLTSNNPDWQKQDESGGLTPDATGAENYTTILAIAPSPVQPGVIWVGTDDGRLQVTRDGGKTWASVEKNVKGVPANTWIPHVEPSRFDAGTAFVVFDDHRRSNWTPYVYETRDYGTTWTSLAAKDLRGYCLTLVQDTVKPDLLFLGTEFGLYVSLDGGGSWLKWTHGLPTVSVMALALQARGNDLVIGTHGRSAYILDDIRPLRSLTQAALAEPIHLFQIPDAQQYRVKQTGASRFPGDGEFRGENRPYGALLTYSLNADGLPLPDPEKERGRREAERASGKKKAAAPTDASGEAPAEKGPEVEIRIADAKGATIRTFKAPATLGVNRAVWDLRRDAFKRPPREQASPFQMGGPEVLPGTYAVTVAYAGHEAKGMVRVVADPRFQISDADRQAHMAAQLRAGGLQETLTAAINRVRRAGSDIDVVLEKLREANAAENGADAPPTGPRKEMIGAGKKLKKSLEALERKLWVPPGTKGIVAETDAFDKVRYVLGSLSSDWDAPTPAQEAYLKEAETAVAAVIPEVNRIFAEDVAAFSHQVQDAGIGLLKSEPPLEVR